MASRLVLVVGDLFIPDRAPEIPPKFRKLLTPGKIGQILCLGNLTDRETFEYFRTVAPDLQLVKGDFDVDSPNLPLSKVVTHGTLRIGFTHGHTIVPPGDPDALLIAARQMDVDVLLWGGTHQFEAYELEGRFFVNPGSLTGALTTAATVADEKLTPSFCLMDLRTDESGTESVAVEKVSFRKPPPSS
ncbi:Vacuolar protein sorting-associated protein 29 [Ascosphaera pollenicola]|nr:Vacuolar protein sorting-associated protein 29 [Ascosphaera pollenicola]